jgi:methyltransferase
VLTRVIVCGYMATDRLIEIFVSRRNSSSFPSTDQGIWSRQTFPLIVALHGIVIWGTLLFGGGRARKGWLLPLLMAQPLRFWTLATLGRRWNARGAVPADMEVETGGPYAYVRHPNYAIVIVELFCLPAAFGLRRLAIAAALANGILLALRIRDEEALLSKLPGYDDHFAGKARFIPGIV